MVDDEDTGELRTITTVVVRQSRDENTVAIVQAGVNDSSNIAGPAQLRDAIERAVSLWASETEEGAIALRNSNFDFNIGDLSHELDSAEPVFHANSKSLRAFLHRQGVMDLTVDCTVGDVTTWTYDELLFDSAKIGEALNAEEKELNG